MTKLNRFIFDLLLINCNFNVQCSNIAKMIMALMKKLMGSTGSYTILTFSLCNVLLEKYYLPRKIVCVVTLSSKQTVSLVENRDPNPQRMDSNLDFKKG